VRRRGLVYSAWPWWVCSGLEHWRKGGVLKRASLQQVETPLAEVLTRGVALNNYWQSFLPVFAGQTDAHVHDHGSEKRVEPGSAWHAILCQLDWLGTRRACPPLINVWRRSCLCLTVSGCSYPCGGYWRFHPFACLWPIPRVSPVWFRSGCAQRVSFIWPNGQTKSGLGPIPQFPLSGYVQRVSPVKEQRERSYRKQLENERHAPSSYHRGQAPNPRQAGSKAMGRSSRHLGV
jgi:hypothetical protein